MAEVTIIYAGKMWTIAEGILTDILAKQMPMEPQSSEVANYGGVVHYCPVCCNILKSPTLDMFKNGSYCDKCGQKIQWGDCSD